MSAMTVSREDQERVSSLLREAVTVLCRNGLRFSSHVMIDGLIGVTLDSSDVFLVKLSERVTKDSRDSGDLSQVSQLLGAANNNFGLSLALSGLQGDGGSPAQIHAYSLSGKDHNDNHQPAAINIAPIGDGAPVGRLALGRGKRHRREKTYEEPSSKRAHLGFDGGCSEPATSNDENLTEDSQDIVIKSEPLDSDEEPAGHFMPGKALGVISAVRSEAHLEPAEQGDDNQEGTAESQEGVLAALRAALIHKLANNGTPLPKTNHNNNIETPTNAVSAPTPTTHSGGKRRRSTPKENNENEVTLKCLMCTYETNRRYNFIRHMRGHSKSYAIYACDLCGDRFHSEDELGAHGLEAHRGHHLTCDQCGMTFMSERGKNIHAKTHKMMPIPEKKTVECETQCCNNDLEESFAEVNASKKSTTTETSTGVGSDDEDSTTPTRYRTLREQLTSSGVVLRCSVPNGEDDDEEVDVQNSAAEEEAKPTNLSLKKKSTSSTSTSKSSSSSTETSPTSSRTRKKSSATATSTSTTAETSTGRSTETKPKEKSRKQDSAQIVRLVQVKAEPAEV